MRNIIIIIAILVLVIGAIFYITMQKNTDVLVVDVTLAPPPDNDISRIISQVNASLSYTKRMEVPDDTPLMSPGITVLVLQEKQEMSGWYSVPIPSNGSIYGTYTVTIKLSGKLDLEKPVRILTRVLDPAGNEVSVKVTTVKLS